MKIVVIGGVAAGTKAAAKLRREMPDARVLLIAAGREISYAGCGLPYYIGGTIRDRAQLVVNTPEQFARATGVEVHTREEATGVDREARRVTARSLDTGEERAYDYDKLVVAVGASAVRPPIAGADLQGVFTLRSPDDAEALRVWLKERAARRIAIVGGGPIGLEVAEGLLAKGIGATVVEMAPHILPGYDVDMCAYMEHFLTEKGIEIRTGARVEAILGEGRATGLRTDQGEVAADAVLLSVGIRPNTAFLADSGIERLPNGTVRVDRTMRTNDPDIYAVGDCVTVTNRITGKPQWSPMGSSANLEGRLAALDLAGEDEEYPGVLGTGVVKLPGIEAGRTGLTAAQAREEGFDAVSAIAVVDGRPHYYPGASVLIVKMVAECGTMRLLGMQVFGGGGVDKAVDVAVTAISLGATLPQLHNMDFAYAPPFSTAIHPVAAAANVLINKMAGNMDSVDPVDFQAGAYDGWRLVDAGRTATVPGALYVNPETVHGPLPELPKDAKLLLVCARGKGAYFLQNRLRHFGYRDTKVLEGGMTFNGWRFKEQG